MKYTRQEVAMLTGKPKKQIGAWCSPSKQFIICDQKPNQDFIDDEIIKNVEFFQKYVPGKTISQIRKEIVAIRERKIESEELGIPQQKPSTPAKAQLKPNSKHTPKEKEPQNEPDTPPEPQPIDETVAYINECKKREYDLKIQKLEKENRIKDIAIEKSSAEFINADKALKTIQSWSTERDKLLLQAIEKNIQYICDRHQIPSDKASKYKRDIHKLINKSNEEAAKIQAELEAQKC